MKGLQSTVSRTTAFLVVFVGVCTVSATVSAQAITQSGVSPVNSQSQVMDSASASLNMVPEPASGNDGAPNPANTRAASSSS
ncbi:hypothetical protein Lepto7376_3149 [[Leptolyngbya] sp. PCC 7376]|uniref:hypothetical protein n=1 Tax=[Leptolyngbya] sp. PCC 7376 TaxID=111781 RepID=UPI00029F0D7E|nr:hypothetical protein [[Leptolyngbya] sp. PCC 7376]AFY39383.1 hypothetical protein Lepto7376_3149 [[Leptolyngbya] sp. PCC 7376]